MLCVYKHGASDCKLQYPPRRQSSLSRERCHSTMGVALQFPCSGCSLAHTQAVTHCLLHVTERGNGGAKKKGERCRNTEVDRRQMPVKWERGEKNYLSLLPTTGCTNWKHKCTNFRSVSEIVPEARKASGRRKNNVNWTSGSVASDKALSRQTASGEAAMACFQHVCVALAETYASWNAGQSA